MHRGLLGTWLPRHPSGILQIAADALQSRIQRDRDPLGQGLHLHLRLYGSSHSTTFRHSRLPPGHRTSLKIRFLESKSICPRIPSGTFTYRYTYSRGKKDTPAYNISPMEMRSLWQNITCIKDPASPLNWIFVYKEGLDLSKEVLWVSLGQLAAKL